MSDSITLSSGRQIYAFRGIIGLSPDMDEIFEGYDGRICDVDYELTRELDGEDDKRFRRDEMIEIADIMIKRWTDFKEKVSPKK